MARRSSKPEEEKDAGKPVEPTESMPEPDTEGQGEDDTIERKIHEVLSSFQQLEQQSHGVHHEATLVPPLWKESLEQQSEVYQENTIPQTIDEELKNETSDTVPSEPMSSDLKELDDEDDWNEPEDRLDKADMHDEEDDDEED